MTNKIAHHPPAHPHTVPKRIEAWFKLSRNVTLRLDAVDESHKGFITPDRGVVIYGKPVYFAPSELSHPFHEMAHMVEIDDRRVRRPNWGLKPGRWTQRPGQDGFYQMSTDQAIKREIRVMAIQAAITEHCGFSFDYVEWARLLASGPIPNYHIWRKNLGMEYQDEQKGYGDSTAISVAVDAGIIKGIRQTISIDSVWKEWARKTAVVDRQIKQARYKYGLYASSQTESLLD